MGFFKNMIKKTVLDILKASPKIYNIHETLDMQGIFIRNKIWYRGDGNELEEFYKNCDGETQSFWGSRGTSGLEIKKTHIGLANLMVKTLTDIVITDFNGIEIDNAQQQMIWDDIEKDNNFDTILKECISDGLAIGDGALKINYDSDISTFPMLEWVSGDKIDIIYQRGRLKEIIFNTYYETEKNKSYLLKEYYGYGYINYKLFEDDKEISLNTIEETNYLKPVTFDKSIILSIPFIINKSEKFKGRGKSIYENKLDIFDSLDEICSQWIESVRRGRAKTYIPESLIPKDPKTGDILRLNAFDNQFIKIETAMDEGSINKIETEQPIIPTDNYLQSYMTFLDLALQGVVSPSTLGIDTKKIVDANASYERQMEKTTTYTRASIVESLNDFIPKVVETSLKCYDILQNQAIDNQIDVNVNFGEYNSPSFDAQIDTVVKAKTGGIMSIKTIINELYGDSKDDEWKAEEVARLQAEQGIVEIDEEPAVNEILKETEEIDI